MNFRKRFQTAVYPPPLRMVLIFGNHVQFTLCMHFILSGPRTFLHIFGHIHYKKIATLFSQNEVASKERRINRNIKLNRSCSHFDTLSLALCERDGPAWHAMPFHFWATHPLPPTPALWQQSQDHAREKCRPSGQGLGKSATPLLGWSECLLCMVHSTIGVVKMNPKTDCLCCQQRCITSMHYWLQALKEVKSGIIAKYFQNFWQLYTYLQNSMINSNLEGSMLQFAHI